jgi:hypothetical protein
MRTSKTARSLEESKQVLLTLARLILLLFSNSIRQAFDSLARNRENLKDVSLGKNPDAQQNGPS